MWKTKECTIHEWYEYFREDTELDDRTVITYMYKCANCEEILQRWHENIK